MFRFLVKRQKIKYSTGGPLKGRESALEEKFIHDHELEVIAKLRKELIEKEKQLAEKISKAGTSITSPIVSETGHVQSDSTTVADETIRFSPVSAASGSFGKREAAAEEQYFKKLSEEKIERLKRSKMNDPLSVNPDPFSVNPNGELLNHGQKL